MSAFNPRHEHLKSWIDAWVNSQSLPGIVAGVFGRDGETLFCHAADNAHRHERVPGSVVDEKTGQAPVCTKYTRDALFRIYSMTKPVTAVAVMLLCERGVLSVDDELSRWIPAFADVSVYVSGPAEAPVTEKPARPLVLRDLLTHTSGITYGFFGNSVCDEILRRHTENEDARNWFAYTPLDKLCENVAKTPLLFQPGAHFHYGLNTDVLGRVVELASGLSLDVFFEQEIFAKLRMHDTSFFVPAEKLHRLVEVYEIAPGHSYTLSTHKERDRTKSRPLLSGGGGLVSSLDDFARFASMLLREGEYTDAQGERARLLQSETVREMTRNQLPGDADLSRFSFDQSFSEVYGAGYDFGYTMNVRI